MYTDVINDHMPLKKVKIKGKQMPFMNRELRRAIRFRKQLWNKYKKLVILAITPIINNKET